MTCSRPEDEREYGWFPFVVQDLDTTGSLVDMSFLNDGIAGESGFIRVNDGHFVDGTGKRIRFFGDNLTFSWSFPEKETARRIAASLRKKGMNVIRFHHMDMRVSPDGLWNETMDDFDPQQLDKLDWLIHQLKLHGVYSNLNLHVSYTYPDAEYADVPGFRFGKSLDHFYRPYIDMQKRYARRLLTHRNPYTGKTYAHEPSVAFVEINNENSLLSNWSYLPNLKPEHRNSLMSRWVGSPQRKKTGGRNFLWIIEHYSEATELQKEMMWSFLVDTEMAYAKEMTGFLRDSLHVQALVTGSQASYSGVAGLYRESEYSDFIDMHAYWEHPRFPNQSWSRTDWLIRNSSMVTDKKAGTLPRFGQHRVAGMPLTISEYDHPAPSFFCAEMYPMLNSVASFQDLDGIYHFTFDGVYDSGRVQGFFSGAGHPMKQIFIPVGAALFRMSEVKPGRHTVQLGIPEHDVIRQLVAFGDRLRLHGSNMNEIWEASGAPAALTVIHPMNVSLEAEQFSLSANVSEPDGRWVSDTDELAWDNRDSLHSVFIINSTSAKAAVGYIGGERIELGDVTIAMDSTVYNWATITLTSLDGRPIRESSRILLVAAGRLENTHMGWNQDSTSVSDKWGTSPTRVEGIPAKVVLKGMNPFKVVAMDAAGHAGPAVNVGREGDEQSFNIGAQYRTLWYMLLRE